MFCMKMKINLEDKEFGVEMATVSFKNIRSVLEQKQYLYESNRMSLYLHEAKYIANRYTDMVILFT